MTKYNQNQFAALLAPTLGLSAKGARAFLQRMDKSGELSPVEKTGYRKPSYYDETQIEQAKEIFRKRAKKPADDVQDVTFALFSEDSIAAADKAPVVIVDDVDDDAEDIREDDSVVAVPTDEEDDDDELIDPPENLSDFDTPTVAALAENSPNVDVKPSSVATPTDAQKNFLPMMTAPNFDAIPQILKDLPRWLCWQLRQKPNGKLTKIPMTPKKDELVFADVTNPENWLTFDEAVSCYNRGLCSGIGFTLSNLSPKVCCVDVDHCFVDGKLTDEASEVIKLCGNSFVEKSQSGEGIHVWFEDDEFNGGRRKGNVEVYSTDRYIAMTGNHIESTAVDLQHVNGACRAVIGRFIGKREGNLFDEKSARAERKADDAAAITTESNMLLSDDDRRLVDYFHSDKCREHDVNMFELFAGNVTSYFKNTGKPIDDSVADCDLMLKTLYYVGGGEGSDADIGQRALKIFGQSELAKRDKWLEREDYRLRTLNAAFEIWNQNGRKVCKPLSSSSSDSNRNANADALIDDLKAALRDVNQKLADFDAERTAALERLNNVEVFDNKTVFSEEILTAAAFAKLSDRQAFSQFRHDVKVYGDDKKHEDKVSINDWLAEVKDHVKIVGNRERALKAQQKELGAQIKSLEFVTADDFLADVAIPSGYSISATGGVEKVAGGSLITVCRRPVVITGKTFDTDTKNNMLTLAYMTTAGKWKKLAPTEKAIVFNSRKLVDLANADLPVTSSNANLLVDYLDAFNAANESKFPLTKQVARCGWHKFNDVDYFIDPRRPCVLTEEGKPVAVKVDDNRSEFTTHLRKVGSLEKWREAYELAKNSPVARLMVAASVAPPLLEVLNERNFLLYVYAPTRAGKTTALTLGASAVGSNKLIRSFDGTKNGLAGAAADVCDFPFLVDEKQVADNRLRDSFSALIYALANGIGRTRLNRDSTLKKVQSWRTIAIMTGETQMIDDNATGGSYTRELPIAAPKEILPADVCKKIRDIIADNYGFAFPLVVDRILAADKERLRASYSDLSEALIEMNPNLLPEHCRYLATLILADAMLNTVLGLEAANVAVKNAVISAKEIFPMIPTTAEISDTEREKGFVIKLLAENQSNFLGSKFYKDGNKMFGKFNDGGYHFVIAGVLKDLCKQAGFDYQKLVADLVETQFFTPAEKPRKGCKKLSPTVQKRIGGIGNVDCYRIACSLFRTEE